MLNFFLAIDFFGVSAFQSSIPSIFKDEYRLHSVGF